MAMLVTHDPQRNSILAIDAAIRRRRDAHHLGMGHVVDSTLIIVRNLEAHRLSRSAEPYTNSLEPWIPAWYVCRGEFASFARGGFSPAAVAISCYALDCTCCMGGDRQRACRCVMAELSR